MLLILLLLVAVAAAAIAGLAIYNRRRRQQTQLAVAEEVQPAAVEETQWMAIGEVQPTVAEEPQPILAEETGQIAAEETQPTSVEEAKAGEVPEERPMAVQETLLTAIAETKSAAVDEALPTEKQELQPIIVEEAQPIVVEGAELTAPEEIELTVEDEAQPQTAEEVSRGKKKKQPKPEKRGGKPRGTAQSYEEGPIQEAKQSRPKPEIVCWKREFQWVSAVELPEELLESSDVVVLQDGSPLSKDESREACWRLERISGEVVVQWNESENVKETKLALNEKYLLFKLSGQNQNQGRYVKFPASGSYLVMVPDDWERDDTLLGPPPVTPEPVSLPGYQAHFFELEKDGDGKIAFRTPTGEPFVIASKAPQFELVGNRLNDASEDKGPLFGEVPPRIRALDEQGWKSVGTIVVGEEGMGKKRWRTHFTPNSDGQEQDLPSEVADRKGGWYFLRFYDTNDDLIESLDFRFTCALKEIRILQPSPLPSEGGYGLVCVVFLHEPGCAVQPADGLTNIQIERQDDTTILTIPPDPTYDETRWLVGREGGPQVEVTILVERLWWSIGEEHNAPSEWKDQPPTLLRDDFAATSKKALWLRLPRRRWVDKVLVGFEQPKARPYDVKVTEKTIAVPLREFGDSKEVGDCTQEYPLKVWIKRDGKFMEEVVAVIPASVVAPEHGQVVSPPTAYWVGLRRKKTAVAEAVLRHGSAKIEVNGHPIDEYFKGTPSKAKRFLYRLLELDRAHEALSQMEVRITVTGSSPITMRQAKAVAHAIARALMSYDPKLKPLLKQAGFGGVRVKKQPVCNGRGNR